MDTAPAPDPAPGPSTAVMPAGPLPRVIAGLGDAPAPSPLLSTWPRCAQFAAAGLLGAFVALLAVWFVGHFGGRPSELQTQDMPAPIDLNRATHAELQHLPGIGPKLAERIVKRREERKGFGSVDDLREVSGIGPATLERLRPYVAVPEPAGEPKALPSRQAKAAPRPAAKQEAAAAPKAPSKKALALQGVVIDVNRAPVSELLRLPTIGPARAKAIVEERQKSPFQCVEDLDRVHGIGPKTVETVRPYVTFGDPGTAVK